MTLMSSILNRFAEASEGWLHQFGQCKNHALASAYCSVLINTRAGLMFLLEETYPLTRSAESGFFLGLGLLYLALLLVLLLGAWQFLNMIAPVRQHQIILDAAQVIDEERISLPAFGKAQHIDGHQTFKRQCRIGHVAGFRAQDNLPHMADIEKARRCPALLVLGHDPHGILQRHGIARKRDHARAKAFMQRE